MSDYNCYSKYNENIKLNLNINDNVDKFEFVIAFNQIVSRFVSLSENLLLYNYNLTYQTFV